MKLLLLFLGTICAAAAQPNPKDEVLKAEAAFNEAKLHNDVVALDRIVAAEYVGFNMWGGGTRNKPELLELFRTFHIDSLVPSDLTVSMSGDTAIVKGFMYESPAWNYLFLRTYIKRNGRWLLLSSGQVFAIDPETMKVVDRR